ncbi:MAG: iron-containing alcohol dehydrogenase [Veillonellaceae bacterium]|nr:iron-containing alcohol dehydrogenase [Veillonellaceae bacterium]
MIGEFTFYAPTKILFGPNCVKQNKNLFTGLGKKAYIITYTIPGKHYALDDVKEILDEAGIEYMIDTAIEENPSMETVERAAAVGKANKVDFMIGIGGGSPIDAAKAIGVLIREPSKSAADLFTDGSLKCLPLIAIPTTAGTGAEVAHWAVLTRNDIHTKQAISPRIFPDYALVDAGYLMKMPVRLTRATALDALCHNIESYVSTASSYLSRALCEISFQLFAECTEAMTNDNYTFEIREKQMLISVIGGLVNTQTGSCLPHGMSYPLTHHKKIPHGLACALLIKEYLAIFKNREKIDRIMALTGFSDLDKFGRFIDGLLQLDVQVTAEELEAYATDFASQQHRFKRHPEPAGKAEVLQIYRNSLLKYNR